MPVYGYVCQRCRRDFEFLLLSPDETIACPSCGSKRVSQLPVQRTAIRSGRWRERRVVDMSSGLCPCGCGKARHLGAR